MKICVSLVLLMLLCPGGCPVYDFDLRTIEQPSQFANGLKLAADLNSEFNEGIMNFHVLNNKDGFEADNTCKLDDLSVEPVEGPTRRLKYLRRAEEEDMSNTEINEFVGSNLFDSTRRNCFSPEDLNLMAARRDFEYLLPKDLPKCLLNDDMLNMLLNYFYNGNELIQRMSDASRKVVERAYYDMLGGYLRSYMLPVAKYSFYGGKASLKVVSSVVELYQQCKSFLNTNGNGWRMPILLEEMDNVRVDSIRGSECGADGNSAGGGPSGCARLEMLPTSDGDDNVMLVALPKLEADCIENGLSNIWLPFRKRRNYDLRSLKSAYVILRFYETVTRCYQSQSMPQEAFNCKFIAWINENLRPHLSDEEFYPGLGGVLRIVEKMRKGRKALDLDDDQALNQRKEDLSGARLGDTVGMGDNSKSDDGFSDMELAQKALEYKVKENARQTMINSKRWFEKSANDNRQLQSRKICDKSKAQQNQHSAHIQQNQTHKAKKPKCKSKGGKHGGAGSLIKLTSEEQKHYLKYLCCIIGLILLILLIILLVAMLLRYRKRRRKTEPKPKPPKKKRRCPAWCSFLLCRKKPADEEIVIKPETKSVIATQPHRRASTSTSSLACQPAAKCIPCSKRATKESESAPIIETTSLDYYSSSEPESKVRQKAKKGKQKVVTIDEKKRKKSASPSPTKTKSAPAKSKPAPTKSKSAPPKSRLSGGTELKSSSSSDSTKRLGIQRTLPTDNKKSSNEAEMALVPQPERAASRDHSKGSRSWETMYDT